jgi:hypothetical protein
MLFVNLMTLKPNLSRLQIDEAAQRRAKWKYPAGLKLVAEYWLQGSTNVLAIIDAEHAGNLLQLSYAWNDVFDIATHPVVTAEEGLRFLQQARVVRRRGRRPKALLAQG